MSQFHKSLIISQSILHNTPYTYRTKRVNKQPRLSFAASAVVGLDEPLVGRLKGARVPAGRCSVSPDKVGNVKQRVQLDSFKVIFGLVYSLSKAIQSVQSIECTRNQITLELVDATLGKLPPRKLKEELEHEEQRLNDDRSRWKSLPLIWHVCVRRRNGKDAREQQQHTRPLRSLEVRCCNDVGGGGFGPRHRGVGRGA